MKPENYSEAREMFRQYLGNGFLMDRDDQYERYKAYAVPAHVENTWLNELIDEYMVRLSVTDVEPLLGLRHCLDGPRFCSIVHLIVTYAIEQVLGTYSLEQLIYAETLIDFARRRHSSHTLIDECTSAAKMLLNDVLSHDRCFQGGSTFPGCPKCPDSPDIVDGMPRTEYLQRRATRSLKTIDSMYGTPR